MVQSLYFYESVENGNAFIGDEWDFGGGVKPIKMLGQSLAIRLVRSSPSCALFDCEKTVLSLTYC